MRTVADRQQYLRVLAELSGELQLELLGYCLMETHVHFVTGARSRAQDLRFAVQRLAHVPARHALETDQVALRPRHWQGRFFAYPIENLASLLFCLRYVDLNPVEDGSVKRPEDYEWSSYRAHIGLASCAWLAPAPSFVALAATPEGRQARYRAFVEQGCAPESQ